MQKPFWKKTFLVLKVLLSLAIGIPLIAWIASFVVRMTMLMIETGSRSASYLGSIALSIPNSFLAKFVFLLIVYLIAIVVIHTTGLWIYCFLAKENNRPTLRKTGAETCKVFCTNNNRRWKYLAFATLVTLVIAIENPGPPLLPAALKSLPTEVFDSSTLDSMSAEYNYQMYGIAKPKAGEPVSQKIPTAAIATTPELTWFWWKAYSFMSFMTFIYFFIAFSDETVAAVKKIVAEIKSRIEAHKAEQVEKQKAAQQAAAQQAAKPKESPDAKKKDDGGKTVTVTAEGEKGVPVATATATINTPSPSTATTSSPVSVKWGQLFTWNVIAEIAVMAFHEWLDHNSMKHRKERG